MKADRFNQLRKQFSEQHVVVIGDVMLDTYYWGTVSRISPEAPVPIVSLTRVDHRPGGAANVAYNLRSLGAEVTLVGVTGQDQAGEQLLRTLDQYDLNHRILVDASRPTTEKIRVIAGSQHVVRLDKEDIDAVSTAMAGELRSKVAEALKNGSALLLQDYNKGTLAPDLILQLIGLARDSGCPVFVDPKIDHLDSYRDVTLIKPNLHEAEQFMHRALRNEKDLRDAGEAFRRHLNVDLVLITRGSAGMDLFDQEGYHQIPTRAREVADVCGAGDTVIGTFALAYLSGASSREAAELANYAAGSVVEEVGVVPVTLEKLEGLLLHYAAQY